MAQELLASFQVPIAAVGGNHDSLRTMRSVLSTDEAGAREMLDRTGWGLHLLETQIPGCEDGDITSPTRGIAGSPSTPTVVCARVWCGSDEPGVW
jgi:hypothetical protein